MKTDNKLKTAELDSFNKTNGRYGRDFWGKNQEKRFCEEIIDYNGKNPDVGRIKDVIESNFSSILEREQIWYSLRKVLKFYMDCFDKHRYYTYSLDSFFSQKKFKEKGKTKGLYYDCFKDDLNCYNFRVYKNMNHKVNEDIFVCEGFQNDAIVAATDFVCSYMKCMEEYLCNPNEYEYLSTPDEELTYDFISIATNAFLTIFEFIYTFRFYPKISIESHRLFKGKNDGYIYNALYNTIKNIYEFKITPISVKNVDADNFPCYNSALVYYNILNDNKKTTDFSNVPIGEKLSFMNVYIPRENKGLKGMAPLSPEMKRRLEELHNRVDFSFEEDVLKKTKGVTYSFDYNLIEDCLILPDQEDAFYEKKLTRGNLLFYYLPLIFTTKWKYAFYNNAKTTFCRPTKEYEEKYIDRSWLSCGHERERTRTKLRECYGDYIHTKNDFVNRILYMSFCASLSFFPKSKRKCYKYLLSLMAYGCEKIKAAFAGAYCTQDFSHDDMYFYNDNGFGLFFNCLKLKDDDETEFRKNEITEVMKKRIKDGSFPYVFRFEDGEFRYGYKYGYPLLNKRESYKDDGFFAYSDEDRYIR